MESFEGPQEKSQNKEEKAREELEQEIAEREKDALERAAKVGGETLVEPDAEEGSERKPSPEEMREELKELGVTLDEEDEAEKDSLSP